MSEENKPVELDPVTLATMLDWIGGDGAVLIANDVAVDTLRKAIVERVAELEEQAHNDGYDSGYDEGQNDSE